MRLMKITLSQLSALLLIAALASSGGEHFRIVCQSGTVGPIDVPCESIECCSSEMQSDIAVPTKKIEPVRCSECVITALSQGFAVFTAQQCRTLVQSAPAMIAWSHEQAIQTPIISGEALRNKVCDPSPTRPLRGLVVIQV